MVKVTIFIIFLIVLGILLGAMLYETVVNIRIKLDFNKIYGNFEVQKSTKLPFAENYLTSCDDYTPPSSLWHYKSWLLMLYKAYRKRGQTDSFSEYVNRIYPIKRKKR